MNKLFAHCTNSGLKFGLFNFFGPGNPALIFKFKVKQKSRTIRDRANKERLKLKLAKRIEIKQVSK